MLKLEQSLRAWNTPEFETVLKRELALNAAQLPLQQGLAQGNHVLDTPITVLIHGVEIQDELIMVRASILYQGMIAGCNCADDPSGGGETNEHCDVLLKLQLDGGMAEVSVLNI